MATAKLPADDYEDFVTGQATTLEGGHVWWRNIIPRDRDRIVGEIQDHAAAYRRRRYNVRVEIAKDRSKADLWLRFSNGAVTAADIEILKGAMAATLVKAGWGGPGLVFLCVGLQSLLPSVLSGIGLA